MSSRLCFAFAVLALYAAAGAGSGAANAGEHPAIPAPPSQAAAPAADDPIVARVNGRDLYRSDIEAAARNLPDGAKTLPFAKVYPVLLQRLINGELLVDAGYQAHLQQTAEVKEELAREEDRLVQHAYIEQIIAAGATDAALKARYDALVKEQPPQDEVRARQILVPTEAEAKSIIDQLNKGADFATLARKYSKDPGTDSAGELGFFTRDQMVPEFAKAAFALPVGQYSKTPVKTEFGWHVIKVEDRRPAKPPSFAEAHDRLMDAVATQLVNDRLKALQKSAKIELFGPDGKPLPPGETAPAAAAPMK